MTRGSMDPVQRGGPWTPGPCFVLTLQGLIRRLWQRWLREYVSHIGSRYKWFSQQKNLKEDDTVVVIDPNATRRDWKVGRIVHTYRGEDGLVRVLDVKVGDRVLKRPITKRSLLEMNG